MSVYKLYLQPEVTPEGFRDKLMKLAGTKGVLKSKHDVILEGEGPEYTLTCKRDVADVARTMNAEVKKIYCDKVT